MLNLALVLMVLTIAVAHVPAKDRGVAIVGTVGMALAFAALFVVAL